MPANLTAHAKGLWNKALQSKTADEKIAALQEFLSAVPKHKGNERLRAQVKRKIAVLKLEIAERGQRRAGKRGIGWSIQKEGAAQVVLIGQTNVGRSSLLAALTNANPAVAGHRFTTTRPAVGITNFEDLRFQLVEAPALVESASKGVGWGLQTLGLARNADGIMIVLDLSENAKGQLEMVLSELENGKISPKLPHSDISVTRSKGGSGIRVTVSGHLVDCSLVDVHKLAEEYGLRNAIIRISGEAKLDDVEDALLDSAAVYKPTVIVANKLDLPRAKQNLEILSQATAGLPLVPVSCVTRENLDEIGRTLFKALGIIRIYTKEPNESTHSTEPFVLPVGSVIAGLAKRIHSELYKNFRYARIWGPTAKYPAEKVGLDHILGDRDIVEIHLK